MNSLRLLLITIIATPACVFADVTLAPIFQDRAVLQRSKPVPVWGRAEAGEKVVVSFNGQTKSTTAGPEGRWSVTLDPMTANAAASTLTVVGKNTLTLTDILVGEVWLASGQSNMEWPVKNTYDAAIDVAASSNPLIRHIKIERRVADQPLETASGAWEAASPSTTGNFTAVGYYFARDIHALVGVPVGIINSTWGGTPVEAWINKEAYQNAPGPAAKVDARWAKIVTDYPAAKAKFDTETAAWKQEQSAAAAAGRPFTKPAPRPPQGPGHQAAPSCLYNAMIAPLVPCAMRGAIWYQGESNAGRADEYHDLFSAMITGWRTRFGQGDFPFYWAQLSNFANNNKPDGAEWAFLREAQTQTLTLPATGQAVILDIGNVNDIHPRNKKDVGRRLARLALARDYGISVVDSGPIAEKIEREGAGFRVRFTQAEGGLIAPLNALSGFELAGADKVFHGAEAKLEQNTVVVTCSAVTEPVAVRYAWRNAPVAGLFNKEGLPATPFRSDNW